MKKNVYSWIPAILWGILLAILSLMPGKKSNFFFFGIPHIDKLAHLGMYAIWSFLVYYAWQINSSTSSRRLIFYTSIVGTVAGVLLEYGQYATSMGRSYEVLDMLANGMGAITGGTFGFLFLKRNKQRDSLKY